MTHLLQIILIMATGPLIGSLIGVARRPSEKYTLAMLSFSAGVMLMISFYELLPESLRYVSPAGALAGLALGGLFIFWANRLISHIKATTPWYHFKKRRLERVIILLIVGILFHNFPEGSAIGLASLSSLDLSVAIALAIAIHDIPEAIATTVPYYHLTNNRLESVLVTMSTLVPTVLGFVLSYYFFQDIPREAIGFFMAITAGIMAFISAFELIPNSVFRGENRLSGTLSLSLGAASVVLITLL